MIPLIQAALSSCAICPLPGGWSVRTKLIWPFRLAMELRTNELRELHPDPRFIPDRPD